MSNIGFLVRHTGLVICNTAFFIGDDEPAIQGDAAI